MYPLKAVLIGRDDQLLPDVRRELLNESIVVDAEYPDVASLMVQLQLHHDEARLFVLLSEDSDNLAPIRQIGGTFPGRPILALLQGEMSQARFVRAMREGAAQVVALPLDIMDLKAALDSLAVQFGHIASRSQVIAVTGAHGGSGATTLATNLAYEIAHHFDRDCLLVELSLNMGVIAAHLDVSPKHSIQELFALGDHLDVYALRQAVHSYGDRLGLLLGPIHLSESPALSGSEISRFVRGLRQLADVVVLDVPATLDELQMAALDAADLTVLVAQQTVPSLHQAAESLDLGIRAHAPLLVVNQYEDATEGLDASQIAGFLNIEQFRTVAHDHGAVNASLNLGRPLRLCDHHSPVLSDIDRVAEYLLGKQRSDDCPRTGVFRRFAQAIGIG